MASWRTGTTKQYEVYLKRWEQFCQSQGINRFDASVENGIDFLATLFTSGLGYSAINTCLLYTSPSPRDLSTSRMPSSA